MSNVVPIVASEVDAEPATAPRPLYTTATLAEHLGVTPNRIHQLRHEKKLPPAVRLGTLLRWRPETIDAWLTAQEEQ
ncbi:MAG: helix-turn-helix domain-containing protein [Gordonia sp. (in: high G+C Gram-positive bacteria)]